MSGVNKGAYLSEDVLKEMFSKFGTPVPKIPCYPRLLFL